MSELKTEVNKSAQRIELLESIIREVVEACNEGDRPKYVERVLEEHGVSAEGNVPDKALDTSGKWEVSVPDIIKQDGTWFVLLEGTTYAEALAYAQTRWGADGRGRASLLNRLPDNGEKGKDEESEADQDGEKSEAGGDKGSHVVDDAVVAELVALLEEDEDDSILDDVVHDTASEDASGVNNSGGEAQVRYLLERRWTAAEIRETIEKARASDDADDDEDDSGT